MKHVCQRDQGTDAVRPRWALLTIATTCAMWFGGRLAAQPSPQPVSIRFTGVVALRQDDPSKGGTLEVVVPNSSRGYYDGTRQVDSHFAYLMVPLDTVDTDMSQGYRDCSIRPTMSIDGSAPAIDYCVFFLRGEELSFPNIAFTQPKPQKLDDVVVFKEICAGDLDRQRVSNPAFVSAHVVFQNAWLQSKGSPKPNCTWTFAPVKENSTTTWTGKPIANLITADGTADSSTPFVITAARVEDSSQKLPAIHFVKVPSLVEIGNAPMTAWTGGTKQKTEHPDNHMLLYYSVVAGHGGSLAYHIPDIDDATCLNAGLQAQRKGKMQSAKKGSVATEASKNGVTPPHHHLLTGDCPPFLFTK